MELLISIGIIATMSTLYIVNVRSYNQSGDLLNAAHEMANNIRLAQNFSLGLKEYDNAGTNVMPAGGWGLYMRRTALDSPPENTFYIIYADWRNNQLHWYSPDEYFRTINLPNGIRIQDLVLYNFSGGSNGRDNASITYQPPDPHVNICRNSAQCDHWAMEIILEEIATSNTITVRLNVHGLVDIN